jgi:hypothetical protein
MTSEIQQAAICLTISDSTHWQKKVKFATPHFCNAYLSEDTTVELWSTGNFAQRVNNQQQCHLFFLALTIKKMVPNDGNHRLLN